mgnify:FL=1
MFFFGKRKIIAAVCFFVFMAVCGWFWRNRETVSFVSQPLSTAEAPFQYGTSQISLLARYGGATIGQIINHWKEVDTLRHENANLKAEQAAYSEILAENIRLKGMLNFKQTYTQYSMLGAKVIAKDYNSWTNTITIDRGSSDGVNKYMPVIVPQGVVGFVSSVSRYTSQVQLLVDPRTAIGGIVQRPESRVASILKGDGNNSDFLVFGNIPKEADVIKGDTIVTSGYGGGHPKGLLIGTVSQVSADGSGVSLAALVKPAVDFTKVEEVFVITNSVQKVSPGDINDQIPIKEPAMNPNEQQASDGDTPVVPAKGE